jgi:hypothetical protein
MVTVLLGAGLVLALVLLVALHYRLSDLPFAVWSEARRERQDNASQALDLMKEAVATKAGAAIVSIRQHEESLAAGYRSRVAEAQGRARMSETRAGDTLTTLNAATVLVRELRQVLDQLPREAEARPALDPDERLTAEIRPEVLETARKPGAPEPASRERPSPRISPPSAAADDGEDAENELTQVAERPRWGLLTKTLVSPGSEGSKR